MTQHSDEYLERLAVVVKHIDDHLDTAVWHGLARVSSKLASLHVAAAQPTIEVSVIHQLGSFDRPLSPKLDKPASLIALKVNNFEQPPLIA